MAIRIIDANFTNPYNISKLVRPVRRTDLIRFGKFTKGYNWDWKGSSDGEVGTYVGKDVNDKYKLYPIPQDEFTTNPYLTQNPDYQK